ncbi:rhodanese-like domain-containing protein [Xylophilus sp.]|uniref:rhodanese-like domain-containing protein n=1 Tax=Xylophilus sp. TaxID=2653893 RepID=UPI0013B96EAA|nr:rhodanese-like domain-containing protein [Xylophilus sp.]KAF1044768.1 MAG: putative protein YibN [Xylophilus sp.]
MNFIVDNWLLFSVAIVSGGLLVAPLLRGGGAGALSAAGAVQLINREKGVLIDLSEPEAFAQGRPAGARNLPLGQLEERLPAVVKNKALPLIFVGQGGQGARARAIAQKLGYEKAQVLGGGLKSWKDANLPVDRN